MRGPLRPHRHQTESIPRRACRQQLRAHDRDRVGQEPRLHRPHRRPRPPRQPRRAWHQGDHRLSHERPGQQPDRRAQEVSPDRLSGAPPVTFGRYTGQEHHEERQRLIEQPPDILLTNYVMLRAGAHPPVGRRAHRPGRPSSASSFSMSFIPTADAKVPMSRSWSAGFARACGAGDVIHVGTLGHARRRRRRGRPKQTAVAALASTVFGVPFRGRQRHRRDPASRRNSETLVDAGELARCMTSGPPASDLAAFVAHPIACWIESNLGVTRDPANRLVRMRPRPLTGENGASEQLAAETGLEPAVCAAALRATLLAGYRTRDELSAGRPSPSGSISSSPAATPCTRRPSWRTTATSR